MMILLLELFLQLFVLLFALMQSQNNPLIPVTEGRNTLARLLFSEKITFPVKRNVIA